MILCMDTSTPTCRLWLVDGERTLLEDSWEAGRELSTGIFRYIQNCLEKTGAGWSDISGIVVFQGPGSFTGLRIGVTVLNTVAHAQAIPIVGTTGDDWRTDGLGRLGDSEDDELVMPAYGAGAHITKPRK
ncbi:tRNA (adenosine(37)-N6)-threonylcarbamoyltransferase complex dimerization subunit type 1 TsaB [Candidatus Saccharibacteria bacterium]|nr:tRNA (adenosine(37)-N6)-threonylcarbamoyltransferase complex dimerization subunit type 1 TsaB [Candidatus Saccharibacteria bacterium]